MDAETIVLTIQERLDDVSDPRTGNALKHPLNSILCSALFGVLAGADDFQAIHYWTEAKQDWLEQFLDFPEGVPSHDTFGRIFRLLDADQLRRCFTRWSRVMATHDEDLVAIDGKTLRRSFRQGDPETALEVVSAWASQNGVTLSALGVDNGQERQGMEATIDLLDLEGCTVSMDALGCTRRLARKLGRQGSDYLMVVKDNQPEVYEQLETFWTWALDDERPDDQSPPPIETVRDVDGVHGRVETRRLDWTDATDALSLARDWPYLEGFGRLESLRDVEGGETTQDVRYVLSSEASPETDEMLSKIRRHWEVENKVHWVMDVTFDEDQSRARLQHAAENLALVRRMAMNILRQDDHREASLAKKRELMAWDFDYFLQVLKDGAAANL